MIRLSVSFSVVCALVVVGAGPSVAEPGRGTTAVTTCPESSPSGSNGNGSAVWGSFTGSRISLVAYAPASAGIKPGGSTRLACTQYGLSLLMGVDVGTKVEYEDGLSVVVSVHTRAGSGGYDTKTSIGCSDNGWISGHGARVTWPVSTFNKRAYETFTCSSPGKNGNARFTVDWDVTPPNGSAYCNWTMTLRRTT